MSDIEREDADEDLDEQESGNAPNPDEETPEDLDEEEFPNALNPDEETPDQQQTLVQFH